MSALISRNPRNAGTPLPLETLKKQELPISGVTPFTTIDFPGCLAAVLYTQGCPWRCEYCQNSHLWEFDKASGLIPWKKISDFMKNRRGLLDGIVFCGGEPTAHESLPEAMREVKALGFRVALHTAGIFPDRLKHVLPFCDWVGMDIKAPFPQYEKITNRPQSGDLAKESAALLLDSNIPYEFRTTVHPDLLNEDDLTEIANQLSVLGAQNYALQVFQANGCQNETLKAAPVPFHVISDSLYNYLSSLFPSFHIRR